MDELTKYQEQCLLQIDRYIEEHRHSPTRQKLSELLGQKSTNDVNQILEALQKKGYIKLDPPRQKRNIVILKRPRRQMDLLDKDDKAWRSEIEPWQKIKMTKRLMGVGGC